MNELLITYPFG